MKANTSTETNNMRNAVSVETERLFTAHQQRIYEQTDRMFAVLMILQWIGGIIAALVISPRTWIGQTSQIHLHVWAAIFLGGAIGFFPIVLALTQPGRPSTRYTIAVAQMLFSSLLIHLTGGRIETHFHVFGSLAFLSFYRDWRVLIPASIVVALDHFVRGVFYPQSVFGVLTPDNWRWLEHGAWVAFEDVFLIISCLRNQKEMRQIAHHTAQLDASEERFRDLFENANDLIYTHDLEGNFLSINKATEKTLGYSREEAVKMNLAQVIVPEYLELARQMSAQKVADGMPTGYELEVLTKYGQQLKLEVSTRLIREDGKPVAIQGIARDITARVQAELALRKSEEYRNLFKHANDAIIIFEPENEWVLDVNDRACEMYGLTRQEFIGLSFKTISKDVKQGERQLEQLLNDRIYSEFETVHMDNNGRLINVHINASVIELQGRPAILSINRDITARKQADAALRESEHKFRTLLGSMSEGLLQVSNEDLIQFANDRFCEMTGYKQEELIGKKAAELLLDEEGCNFIKQANVRRCEGTSDVYEMRLRKKDGETLWALIGGAPVVNADGEVIGSMGVHTDITERKRAEEQLLHNALHDALTDLPNRALFLEHLRSAIDRSARHLDITFAVLFLDFDRFKIVNDSLGHMEGDKLLVLIAQRLKASLRPGDIVARLGGDEFTILLNEIEDLEDALYIVERIENTLKDSFNLAGREVFTSASIGIALSNSSYIKPEELLRDADIAMYHAKAAGKARHQIFSQAMHERASSRLQFETEMRHALERQEFCLYYQPIVEIGDNRIVGFESLVRWQHPERGLVSPVEFIPVAEETGLIVPLGEWVLRESCRQMRAWQLQDEMYADLTISVNLSCKQFIQSDLAEDVCEILRETNLDARHLRLEITESHFMEDSQAAIEIMNRLRALGIKLSIDDFGTGYSSLSYLHRLPINYLKIDRSFVSKMQSNHENGEIIRSIIMLANNLGIEVIAEGIETNDQMQHLKNLSCKFGQGYLFSKPVNAEQAKLLLETMPDVSVINEPSFSFSPLDNNFIQQ